MAWNKRRPNPVFSKDATVLALVLQAQSCEPLFSTISHRLALLRQTLNGKILKGDFSPMFKLKLANKDMRLIVEMAQTLGTPIQVGKGVLDWYERGESKGHGELDWGAILLVSNPELKAQ